MSFFPFILAIQSNRYAIVKLLEVMSPSEVNKTDKYGQHPYDVGPESQIHRIMHLFLDSPKLEIGLLFDFCENLLHFVDVVKMRRWIQAILFYNDQTTKDTPESVEVACHKLVDRLLASPNVTMEQLVVINFFTTIVYHHADDLFMKIAKWKGFEPKLLRTERDAQGRLHGRPLMHDAMIEAEPFVHESGFFEELVKCPELRDEVEFFHFDILTTFMQILVPIAGDNLSMIHVAIRENRSAVVEVFLEATKGDAFKASVKPPILQYAEEQEAEYCLEVIEEFEERYATL